jgi:dihydrofolate synthase/folylpolyglutamate synthase
VTYNQATEWLYSRQLFGIKLGLDTMRRLCTALGIDLGPPSVPSREPLVPAYPEGILSIKGLQQREPAGANVGERPIFLHVAGTNGKGSVCAMLDSILRVAGLRVGLYTSPHLVTFRERIRLNGEMISESEAATGLTRIRELVEGWEPAPTFFEIATALALDWFEDQHAHVVVLETGLGGRLDATNVVTPAVSVLTSIGLDHEKFLGSTVAKIAAEKAGIIKPGVPVVSAPQVPAVRKVLARVAERNQTSCEFIEEPWRDSPISLAGSHQLLNAQLAYFALLAGSGTQRLLDVLPTDVAKGLARVEWPGRFQRIGERIILDGAHNPAAAQRLAQTWREEFGDAQATLVLGAMRDKDVRGVCAALAPIAARVYAVRVDNPRSCSAEELAGTVRSFAPGVECGEFPSLAPALVAAKKYPERILIAGSLFLVGEALVELALAEAKPERSVQ